jgi:Carboxypeptidase regulatory-like domain/TonB dependent receptor
MQRSLVGFLLVSTLAFGQSDRGTVTGTISDPAGAVVAAAPIQLKNADTGVVFEAASSGTGNYTIAQVPAGNYELAVTVQGFKRYVRQNIVVQVNQIIRLDVPLEVGASTESVTVSAEVSLLKTENAEMSHTISAQRLNDLPILGIGGNFSSSNGLRFYMAEAQLVPGTYFQVSSTGTATIKVNGAPSGTQRTQIDGMDATNTLNGVPASMQPSVDAIQETTILVSDYSAEFGQVGGGLFNITTKSGTNQYHGSAFDYFANEALNAATPFTNINPRQRRNNYGFSVGGPIVIPKLYNGHDKSFFFYNREQFRENGIINNQPITVPTSAYRNGDFSAILGSRVASAATANPLGVAVLEGMIFDPNTTRTVNGQIVRDQFPGNFIPAARFDSVSRKIQALIPSPSSTALFSNLTPSFPVARVTTNESVKLDHTINQKAKIAGSWGTNATGAQYSTNLNGSEGLPDVLTATRGTFTQSYTYRINFDYSATPTLLLHLGAGLVNYPFNTDSPVKTYDQVAELGLRGATVNGAAGGRFPAINGLCQTGTSPLCTGNGGMANMGPQAGGVGNQTTQRQTIPSFNASVTWVKGNHTYKFGSELRLDGWVNHSLNSTMGTYVFSAAQTGQPYTNNNAPGGINIGFGYASFLLGQPNTVRVDAPADTRFGKKQWGFFAQDNWKITRKMTLDYGLRYDYSLTPTEQYGRLPNVNFELANPSAGGRPGAIVYEATCNCSFSKNYPFAFGPRIGLAYQINSKTVLRTGFGVSYTGTGNAQTANGSANPANTTSNPQFGQAVMQLQDGVPASFQRAFPSLIPGAFPAPNNPAGLTAPPIVVDQNGGRPARQMQYSFGLQREIFPNMVVDASYVGNRGVWWPSTNLVDYNALTPQRIAAFGLNVNSAADQAILRSTISTAGAAQFRNVVPYTGFPTSATVAQSLRPFPQFSGLPTATTNMAPLWAPLGTTYYDSMQLKLTKRMSRGMDFTYAFTFSKELQNGTGGNISDVFNRSINKSLSTLSRPFVHVIAANYHTPKWNLNKAVAFATGDWTLGAVLQYASGTPISAPTSNNTLGTLLFRNTYFTRVPGVDLYLKDLNCHCIDPKKDLVLNPAAWTDAAQGQFTGSAIYFNDYRTQRRPQESMSLARNFPIREKMSLMIRAEFSNIFNRTQINDPTATNPAAAVTCSAGASNSATCVNPETRGILTGGFGFINTATVASPPRTGTLVARFTF